ncbi:MAG: sugar phosphate nucleotidyltransferase, partial [Candidatus Paceibacterota bacterium]
MTKKVVIAAAGKGTRMLHLTRNKSKHLIKVNKKPFLSYLLDNLLEAGYRDFILVVGYKEESIREFLKEYNYKAKVVNQFEILGEKEYGTACPLKCVKDI